jgi:hypothetical protein
MVGLRVVVLGRLGGLSPQPRACALSCPSPACIPCGPGSLPYPGLLCACVSAGGQSLAKSGTMYPRHTGGLRGDTRVKQGNPGPPITGRGSDDTPWPVLHSLLLRCVRAGIATRPGPLIQCWYSYHVQSGGGPGFILLRAATFKVLEDPEISRASSGRSDRSCRASRPRPRKRGLWLCCPLVPTRARRACSPWPSRARRSRA